MRKYILIGLLYTLGALFFVDVLNNGFIVEELLFDVMEWKYLIILMMLYFLAFQFSIYGLNLYLHLKIEKDNQIQKWATILFLPLYSFTLVEAVFSVFGIIDMPQSDISIMYKGFLVILCVAFLVFGYGIYRVKEERDNKIIKYMYVLMNIGLFLLVLEGMI